MLQVVGGKKIVKTSGAGKRRVSQAQHNMFAMCRASKWQSNLRENMSAPCHHQLGTQRVDHNNIGNQKCHPHRSQGQLDERNHCALKQRPTNMFVDHRTEAQQGANTDKPHQKQRHKQVTPLQKSATRCTTSCAQWTVLRKYRAVPHNTRHKTECNNRKDPNDGAP